MDPSRAHAACYPVSVLPGASRLFLDYAAGEASAFYPAASWNEGWMLSGASVEPRPELAALLQAQNQAWHAGPLALESIAKLRAGARAVVTGQQVGLFGGPLYTLMKAASAVRLAQMASEHTGEAHVPIFWLASEDHDFAEIDHVRLRARDGELQTVRVDHPAARGLAPVGSLRLGSPVEPALARAAELLGARGPQVELLGRCWRPEATFAGAFAQWLSAVFREYGLVIFDAGGRAAHRLGVKVLRAAIEQAPELEAALLERGRALEAAGYHQQVLVKPGGSLLFLITGDAENDPHARVPLRRGPDGSWIVGTGIMGTGTAGTGTAGRASFSTSDLLKILDREPERLSPNALLRPVFQDAILPTAAYVGGPAEVAYFAQTGVLHEQILGRATPVLPRLSATVLENGDLRTMERDGIDLPEIFRMPLEEMAQRAGARAMPFEGKRKLKSTADALFTELDALTGWMRELDPELGRSADVAASKMRYQMNRLRRLAARRELERDAGTRRRVEALYSSVYPNKHLQERAEGAASALARHGESLVAALVEAAGDLCPGHKPVTP